MRVLLFTLLSGLAHGLAARWLLSTLAPATRRAWRARVIGAALLLSLLLGAMRVLATVHETEAVRSLLAVVILELGAVILSLLPVGVLALVVRAAARLGGRERQTDRDARDAPDPARPQPPSVSRRQAIERVGGLSLFGATAAALGWGMVRGRHAFALEEVVVRVKGWPRALEGYTIAQISDVHVGAFVGERELDEGFALVERLRPDLLVATGDLVDFDADAIGALALRLLRAPSRDGAYAILGNHDHYAGAASVVAGLRSAGVNVLDNAAVRLRREDGGGFALLGVDDLHGRRGHTPGFRGPDLERASKGLPAGLPRILLAHQPLFFDEAAGRIALQLSGHTHGGQINPGFRPADAFMKYVSGRYQRDGSTLYVNRGFGVAGPPSRLLAPPEVTRIVIVGA